ncbi:hypothetical protein H1R82_04125 [Thermoactinomyces intermedius]|jgi:hypothetical protein|uniref:Uncharacterized protein n=1 Tax=Thermoactinomyces intermedius TaxID=2024 RepID=A0A8I1DBI5_THEIN|nr:hypothetical protein [Thermoactinomyces intermedius]MBA4548540.1 hypothetical protein [Thermoactinomyces intermedius]MBA4835820.1 hypothetical protein [Thermoactinomyces intermedius]MBH8594418.1 hypothetical protein [Thermoactinomyces intermedius]
MNLEELKGRPNPEPPELIKNVAKEHLKDGEKFNIYPQKAFLNGKTYFYATYCNVGDTKEELTGILVIREDGSLPLHKECLDVYYYLSGVETGLTNVLAQGSDWSKRPMGVWKKLQSLLDSFADTVHASNDPAFQKGYDVFCSIPNTMFETQDQLKEVVENAKKYYTELTTDYVVTKEFHDKVDENYRLMMENMKKQFEVQIETEEERTKFMKQLKASISFLDLSKQVSYMRLNKLHKWLNADKATMDEYEDFKNDIYREKANAQGRKKQIEMIRNPRD